MDQATGPDVSHFRVITDFPALVAAGHSFVGIKATQGTTFVDPTLVAHRDGRRATPGLVSAVFYHYPGDEAGNLGVPEEEAAHFVASLGPLRGDELLAQDVEQGPSGHGAPPIDWQKRFNAALPVRRRADGTLLPNGVYVATHVWNEIGNPGWADATVGNVFLWIKRYAPAIGPLPDPWTVATFWQCSETAVVPGIAQPADLNRFLLGDAAALTKWLTGS